MLSVTHITHNAAVLSILTCCFISLLFSVTGPVFAVVCNVAEPNIVKLEQE